MAKKPPLVIMNDLGKMAHDKAQPKLDNEAEEMAEQKPAKVKKNVKGLKVPKPAGQ